MSDADWDVDVVVVGAGAAGLAATHRLHKAGRKVLCLESADRIGGRSYTDTAIFGVPFDMGGHWLHYGDANSFIPIGSKLGFDIYEASEDFYFKGETPQDTLNAILADVEEELIRQTKAATDMSMTDAFDPNDDLERTAVFLKALSAGRDLDEISMHDWHTVGLEDDNWYCRQGFGAIVTRHAEGLPVQINSPVRAIARTASGVEIETPQGKITAGYAIVTVSVGVLAAEAIRFDPPLDGAKLAVLDRVTMGTYNHIAMLFSPETLPLRPDTWVGYPIKDLSGNMARGGGVLCNISGTGLCSFEHIGNFAKELEAAGQKVAVDFALSRMVEIFGSNIRQGFKKGYATRWSSNKHTRGAYSGTLPSQDGPRGADLRADLRRPHAHVIHFAGEAMNDAETVTVSGAHKEGLRAAEEILADYGV